MVCTDPSLSPAISRSITQDVLGRNMLVKKSNIKRIGFIHTLYPNRAMEWINIRHICSEALRKQGSEDLIPHLESITFGWRYHEQFCSMAYRPAKVFRDFSFDENIFRSPCPCNSPQRFSKYLNSDTASIHPSETIPSLTDRHVRTMDTGIIRDNTLKENFTSGLNHIPLRQTLLHEVVETVLDAWTQLCQILQVDPCEQTPWIRNRSWEILKEKASVNIGGFKYSQPSFKKIHAATDELRWLQQFLFIAGLDKATANASFICVSHMRAQALLRLQGKYFTPCLHNEAWISPVQKEEEVFEEMCVLLPEIPLQSARLPYLMGTFKQHKNTYRWLTNAHKSIFSNIAQLITTALMGIIPVLIQWCAKRIQTYRSIMGTETKNFWMIDSVIDLALNLPEMVNDVFVADIAQCYETIPLEGNDNLMSAISKLVSYAFQQKRIDHPRSLQTLWVRFDERKMVASTARWATHSPKDGLWIEFTEERLISLNRWLSSNCFVTLGDRVWQQISGIPMGFSCSPLWCNMYFLHYEINFIARLASLGRTDLMRRFRYSFRYIDDLCILNNGDVLQFLDPNAERVASNPFWIYPLGIVQIKSEIDRFSAMFPQRGTSAHFMNMQISVINEVNGEFRTHKFDKRRNLPFKYSQFLQFRSNRSVSQSYNIIQSQAFSILYLSSNEHDVLNELDDLLQVLTANGFRRNKLKSRLLKFLRHGCFPGLRFDLAKVVHCLERSVVPYTFRKRMYMTQIHSKPSTCLCDC